MNYRLALLNGNPSPQFEVPLYQRNAFDVNQKLPRKNRKRRNQRRKHHQRQCAVLSDDVIRLIFTFASDTCYFRDLMLVSVSWHRCVVERFPLKTFLFMVNSRMGIKLNSFACLQKFYAITPMDRQLQPHVQNKMQFINSV